MSPGLPGLGLGGLFFVISALVAPLVELHRTVRGRSGVEAWRQVARQFAIAVAMIVAVDLAVRGLLLATATLGGNTGARGGGLTALPLEPIGITTALLAGVLLAAKALQLGLRAGRRRGASPNARPALCPHPCTCCTGV